MKCLLNKFFKNNFSNFPLTLLSMPEKFYLYEILLHAPVTFMKVSCILFTCTLVIPLTRRQKSTCTLYMMSVHYNWDIVMWCGSVVLSHVWTDCWKDGPDRPWFLVEDMHERPRLLYCRISNKSPAACVLHQLVISLWQGQWSFWLDFELWHLSIVKVMCVLQNTKCTIIIVLLVGGQRYLK